LTDLIKFHEVLIMTSIQTELSHDRRE